MHLWQLESAIKKQCIWNYNTNKKLQTDPRYEKKGELGLILFVGIAFMYGFEKKDILSHADIEPQIYEKRLKEFKNCHRTMMARMNTPNIMKKDYRWKVYIKTVLVQNYIRLHHNNEGYLSDKDFLLLNT